MAENTSKDKKRGSPITGFPVVLNFSLSYDLKSQQVSLTLGDTGGVHSLRYLSSGGGDV